MPFALLSVSDKSGLVELGSALIEMDWELLASGGTSQALQAAGLPVTEISAYTGSPEVLGGRVKTLHPAVHAGLLARRTDADREELYALGGREIDLVAVNLYPFAQTVLKPGADLGAALENIDIGGVALLRAAAKNFEHVLVVSDPDDYPLVITGLKSGQIDGALRRRLAYRAFAHTAAYDAAIAGYLGAGLPADEQARMPLNLVLYPAGELRYGENPHQSAGLYTYAPEGGPLGGNLLHGKPLSYNNLLDLDAAWRAVLAFDEPAVCILKHLSPCGLAVNDSLVEAYRAALASDPVSAFGSVIAVNREFSLPLVEELGDLFVECIVAPGFSPQAREYFLARKNLRLLEMPDLHITPGIELRSINRGVLRQAVDFGDPPQAEWRVVSRRAPSEKEWLALRFAWKVCQHVKSNAIVFAQGQATVGIGGGQPNRVDCVRIAARRAGGRARGAVMASDAFFPFPDGIEEAAQAGIVAVVQPGGARHDEDVIAAADAAGMSLVFTGSRHFRH